MDSRVGSKYIKPGLGFGGPCFPRDNQAFAAFAAMLETEAKLAKMVDEVNRDQIVRVVNRAKEILATLKKEKNKARIAILGLSYKPNTPIIEDSQALNIAQMLIAEGYNLSVFDPQANEFARSVLGNSVKYAKDKEECILGADLIVIAVPWKEFKNINPKKLNKKAAMLDCWQLLDNKKAPNIHYLGVG